MNVRVVTARFEIVEALLENYMSSRKRPSTVSTKAAARAVTSYMSDCPIRGRALENAIAEAAVRHGHAVAFDFKEPAREIESVVQLSR